MVTHYLSKNISTLGESSRPKSVSKMFYKYRKSCRQKYLLIRKQEYDYEYEYDSSTYGTPFDKYDVDCLLPKRKTKKIKIENCADKNTKASSKTKYDTIKLFKTKRASKKNVRNQSDKNKQCLNLYETIETINLNDERDSNQKKLDELINFWEMQIQLQEESNWNDFFNSIY